MTVHSSTQAPSAGLAAAGQLAAASPLAGSAPPNTPIQMQQIEAVDGPADHPQDDQHADGHSCCGHDHAHDDSKSGSSLLTSYASNVATWVIIPFFQGVCYGLGEGFARVWIGRFFGINPAALYQAKSSKKVAVKPPAAVSAEPDPTPGLTGTLMKRPLIVKAEVDKTWSRLWSSESPEALIRKRRENSGASKEGLAKLGLIVVDDMAGRAVSESYDER
ncbi:uncharacterized protein BJ171DRAFT_498695, partial [Polychytrium aggregatum]|uniref:uncharacterized protein n=1 Tax=Polychytrium aggregatum TaxID=110093 RepID=UPI0022FE0A99